MAVEADQPLKMLFRLRAADLLALTGDRGARVLSTQVVELPAGRRSVDTVVPLRRGPDVFLRHLVFLKPPAPSSLAFEESIGGRVVHARRFDVIRLWELDPREMLRLGPGTAALVGPMRRTTFAVVARAARCILRRAPRNERSDLLAILHTLSEGRYTAMQLARVIPRGVVMTSSLFAATRRLGREEGRREGAEMAFRRSLGAILRRRHPDLATRIAAVAERCNDVAQLERWVVAASELSSDELLKLMLPGAPRKSARTARASARPLARKRAARPKPRSPKTTSGR